MIGADPNPADFSSVLYAKIHVDGDTTSPTWTWSAKNTIGTDIVAYRNTSLPVNAISSAIGVDNTLELTVTPTSDDCMIVAFAAIDTSTTARTWTIPGTMTEVAEKHSSLHRYIAQELLSGGSGIAVSRTLEFSGSEQDWDGFIVALAPSA